MLLLLRRLERPRGGGLPWLCLGCMAAKGWLKLFLLRRSLILCLLLLPSVAWWRPCWWPQRWWPRACKLLLTSQAGYDRGAGGSANGWSSAAGAGCFAGSGSRCLANVCSANGWIQS